MCCAVSTDKSPDCASTTWVLSWQAAVGREFFRDPSLYPLIRGRLIDAHQRAGRELVDYLLLPTEIHAIARISDGDSAGGIARAIGNVVSRWVREAQPVRSPVLAGPYRAQLLGSDDDVRHEVRWVKVKGHAGVPMNERVDGLAVAAIRRLREEA